MKGFLLDENLPNRLRFKPSLAVCHANEVGPHSSDEDLWNYAKAHELVIVTKDADFTDRVLPEKPPPWVVHLCFGNLRRNDFHVFLKQIWPRLEELLQSNKLLNVYLDRVEVVS